MKFISTRGKSPSLTVSQAMEQGLAPDGGLYVPEKFPQIDLERFNFSPSFNDYPQFAAQVLKPFFEGDSLAQQLDEICARAFSFPIVLKEIQNPPSSNQAKNKISVLELFHGPTAAFKDVAARFLADCLSRNREASTPSGTASGMNTILVATSGDTGGAVAAAFHNRPGFEVVIVFPQDGVSERQRKQLTGWGDNIHAFAVKGSFDRCQELVKTALFDGQLRSAKKLSSANSINIGRLLPQASYYAMASFIEFKKNARSSSFIIPSGNVGNAAAAMWAKKMGFPIHRIVMATNANRVIPDYFKSGEWKPLPSLSTLANAMDVGNASNMERVFHLEQTGFDVRKNVSSDSITDEEIRQTLQNGERDYGEIWCPHTATAVCLSERLPEASNESIIVVATAHPAKFETVVEPLIGHAVAVPAALANLLNAPSHCQEITGENSDQLYAKFKKLFLE